MFQLRPHKAQGRSRIRRHALSAGEMQLHLAPGESPGANPTPPWYVRYKPPKSHCEPISASAAYLSEE